jgi:Flp pilus assembly protein protease CpaA
LSWCFDDTPVFDAGLFFLLGIVSVMIAVFITDLKEQLIPDELQIAFFLIALAEKIVNGASLIDIGYAIAAGLSGGRFLFCLCIFSRKDGGWGSGT